MKTYKTVEDNIRYLRIENYRLKKQLKTLQDFIIPEIEYMANIALRVKLLEKKERERSMSETHHLNDPTIMFFYD